MVSRSSNHHIAPTSSIHKDIEFCGNGSVIIEDFCDVGNRVIFDTGGGEDGLIRLSSRAKIKSGCILRAYGNQIHIGHRVSIGECSLIAAHGGVEIDDNTMVAPFAILNAAGHIIKDKTPYRFQGETTSGICIGKNVWIGARSTILDGVAIGDNAIIGAHSLVTRSIPENFLAFGSPATIQNAIKQGDEE